MKIVICVEGWTEFHFVSKLVEEMAGYQKIHQDLYCQEGSFYLYGKRGVPEDNAEINLLLVNCCSDGKVKSFILERLDLFVNKGYSAILGLQDLLPRQYKEWQIMESTLNKGLDNYGINVSITLQVMECEAWFLNESTHFIKIDPALTPENILAHTGFNPVADCAESEIPHPAVLLDEIYRIVGLRWDKRRDSDIPRTINSLDYDEIFVTVREMSRSLDTFLKKLEEIIVFEKPPQACH